MSAPRKGTAMRRYLIRLAVLMALYIVILIGAKIAFRQLDQSGDQTGPLAYALALAPALPLIGVFWAVFRLLVEETDEYLRLLLVRQTLFATAFCLIIMTVWEWLQNFDLVPPGNGGFGAAFWWFVGLGFGGLFNKLTIGDSGAGCEREADDAPGGHQ
jgi:hypothetical protein